MNWTRSTIPSLDLPTCLDHLSHLERKWQQGLRSSTLLKIQKMAICCCLRTGIVAITKIGRQWKCVSKAAKLATNHNNDPEIKQLRKFGIKSEDRQRKFYNAEKHIYDIFNNIEKTIHTIHTQQFTSASDSRSEGCVFKSRRGQTFLSVNKLKCERTTLSVLL